MGYDISLHRAAKAARIAAGQAKYEDLCPTGPTPEDDARVEAERRAVIIGPPVLAVSPVAEPVAENKPEFAETVPAES